MEFDYTITQKPFYIQNSDIFLARATNDAGWSRNVRNWGQNVQQNFS